MEIDQKIAVVTGASSGLGRAATEALVKDGAKVYGLGRNQESLNKLSNELGTSFIAVQLDICNEKLLKEWVSSTFNQSYYPHILINNAGVSQFEDVDQLSSKDWHQMVNTNLTAVHLLTAALVPFMKQDENSSHIINIGSILGKVSGSQKSAYSATKFAIQGYSEALFKELRGFNIKVSCFNSGSINTHFFESSGIQPNSRMLQPDELADILMFILKTPDNVLIDELTVRPLRP